MTRSKLKYVDQYPDFSVYVDDMIMPPAFREDPLSQVLKIAEHGPVVKGKRGKFVGVPYPDMFTRAGSDEDVYLALSFDACRKVVTNHRVFLNGPAYADTLAVTAPGAIVTLDDPEHRRNKSLVMPSFSHHRANEGLQPMMQKIIGETVDSIAHKGEAELMSAVTSRFPWQIIATLFGLPLDQRGACEAAGTDSQKAVTDPAAAQRAIESFHAIYQKIIDDHRAEPKDDLTTMLINTEVDGEKLSDAEIRAFLINLVSAGLDTTHRQTAIMVTQLLEHPDQLQLLREQPELLDQAIWESLRYCATTGSFARVAGEDCEVEGVLIPKGSRVLISVHSANHDTKYWDNPQIFDITREKQPIMSFNLGRHSCLGQNLAQAEIRIAITNILEKLPNLRKDEDRWHTMQWGGYYFRSPTQLPVKWDVPN